MPTVASKWTSICKQSVCCFALSFVATSFVNAEGGKILKWKDEKGVTHYGDRIPPQYANRENTTISQQGIAVRQNKPITNQNQALDVAKLEQDKKDKALLGAFSNESEIDLARDRNLQLDLVSLENLQQDKNNVQKRLVDNKKSVDALTKQKKKIPPDLSANIANNQMVNAKLDQQISERKLVIENTRQRFEQDKQRYIALKYPNASNPPGETLAPVNDVAEKTTSKSVAPSGR
jgi:hypothetical protein